MEDKKDKKIINNSTVGMAQKNLNQIHGEAASQTIQAYKGIRVDKFGDEITHKGRNLKDISNYKLNPKFKDINIKQQSGFSAELIEEARENKEAILSGETTRTRTTDGIGRTNDTQYDHVKVDSNGNVIENSGSQMKFLKKTINPKTGKVKYDVIEKLANKEDWNRYDTKITVPKDDYEGALKYAEEKYNENIELYKKTLEKGKLTEAEKYKRRAEDYKNAKERIQPAKLTGEEAINARKNPEKFVINEVTKDVHNAGICAAKGGAIVGGSISIAQNLFAMIKDNKDIDEAIKDITLSTIKAGTTAYTVGAGGTAIKTLMHSSKNQIVRRMGTTSLPTLIVTGALEIGSSMKKYINGEISELELFEEIGEKGVGMVTAGYCAGTGAVVGATIGSAIPVVGTAIGGVVGGFVGSILGYNISGILYREAIGALRAEKISYERRLVIEELAKQAIEENKRYKEMFIEFSKNKLVEREEKINFLFDELDKSIFNYKIDDFFVSVNSIGEIFGYNLQFKDMKEFDDFMKEENSILEL